MTTEPQHVLYLIRTSDEEAREFLRTSRPGYFSSVKHHVPDEWWEEGVGIRVESGAYKIERSFRRLALRQNIRLSVDWVGRDREAATFWNRGQLRDDARVKAPGNKYMRPWDRVLSVPALALVKERRRNPDGVERKVRYSQRAGKRIQNYPWQQLHDGDYFIALMEKATPAEERVMRNGFVRRSAFYDYEIQIERWEVRKDGEFFPALRVTRIQGDLASLKRRYAKAAGVNIEISNGGRVAKPTKKQETKIRHLVKAIVGIGYDEKEAKSIASELAEKAGVPVRTRAQSNWTAGADGSIWAEGEGSPPEHGNVAGSETGTSDRPITGLHEGSLGLGDDSRHAGAVADSDGVPGRIDAPDVHTPDGGITDAESSTRGEQVEGVAGQRGRPRGGHERGAESPRKRQQGPSERGIERNRPDSEEVLGTSGTTGSEVQRSGDADLPLSGEINVDDAYAPGYNRSEIMRQRLAALLKED